MQRLRECYEACGLVAVRQSNKCLGQVVLVGEREAEREWDLISKPHWLDLNTTTNQKERTKWCIYIIKKLYFFPLILTVNKIEVLLIYIAQRQSFDSFKLFWRLKVCF